MKFVLVFFILISCASRAPVQVHSKSQTTEVGHKVFWTLKIEENGTLTIPDTQVFVKKKDGTFEAFMPVYRLDPKEAVYVYESSYLLEEMISGPESFEMRLEKGSMIQGSITLQEEPQSVVLPAIKFEKD